MQKRFNGPWSRAGYVTYPTKGSTLKNALGGLLAGLVMIAVPVAVAMWAGKL